MDSFYCSSDLTKLNYFALITSTCFSESPVSLTNAKALASSYYWLRAIEESQLKAELLMEIDLWNFCKDLLQ